MEQPLTIADAAALIRRGELLPTDLLEQCLARMDAYEPAVRAWVHVDRDRARYEAQLLTRELQEGRYFGPLHGIPIGVKDIFDVFDMPTGCGSERWAGSFAHSDAAIVKALRKAGALILGKTVTTPYAFLDPPPTRNPWDLERTPGGSSSGSAAAVACGTCLAAVATQTGGSTLRPATYCGVAGYKPTWGRFSLDGCLPLAPSLDHLGLIARTVRDLGILYEALTRGNSGESYVPNRRLAVMPGFQPTELDAAFAESWNSVRNSLVETGWELQEVEVPDTIATFAEHQHAIYSREAWQVHGHRRNRHAEDYPPRITELIEFGCNLPADALHAAWEHYIQTRQGIRAAIADEFAGVLTPASGAAAPKLNSTGNPGWQAPWTYAGAPMVSWPLPGDGLPIGAQLIGRPMEDFALLATAAQLEAAAGRTPSLPPVPA